MVSNQKVTGTAVSIPKGLVISVCISIFITLAGAGLIAMMVNTEKLPESKIGYGIMIILPLASYIGSYSAWKKIKRRKILVCLTAGVIYWAALLSLTALFFGGQYKAIAETALLLLCGSFLAILTKQRDKRQKISKITKRVYR